MEFVIELSNQGRVDNLYFELDMFSVPKRPKNKFEIERYIMCAFFDQVAKCDMVKKYRFNVRFNWRDNVST